MAYLNSTLTLPNMIAALAASSVEKAATRYKRHRIYSESFEEMSALSDRELKDLGLSRAGLRCLAWESAQNAKL